MYPLYAEGKPTHRTELIHDSDFDIVDRYGAEYRGIVQYYVLAHNVRWLGGALVVHGEFSPQDTGEKAQHHDHEDGTAL